MEEKPGLVIRDPFHYSEATLIIPPPLVGCLEFFDGERTDLDLREYLVRLSGDIQVGDLQQHLVDALSTAGFLEDEAFALRKQEAERAFAEAPVRMPVHAGSGYPSEAAELTETFREYLNGPAPVSPMSPISQGRVLAIAAPHVSPF